MQRLLLVFLVVLGGGGCVSQTTISGTDQAVIQQRFDADAASNTRISLALRYLQAGDIQQAKLNLDKALQHSPASPEVHSAFGYYYQQVGETELATQAYRRSLRFDPDNADTLNNFGVFLCQQRRFAEAEPLFLKALQQPGYVKVADTYENAGVCARAAGRLDSARQYLQAALNYNPQRPRALLEAAAVELEAGKLVEVRGYLLRYGQVAPATAQSLRLWELLEQAAGRPQEAAAYRLERVLSFPDTDSTRHD